MVYSNTQTSGKREQLIYAHIDRALARKHIQFALDHQNDSLEQLAAYLRRCAYSAPDGITMTLTAPETLSGMTARVDSSGAKLVFDGAEIGFSTLAGGRLAPMAAPWVLADCWANGYIAWSGMEGDLLRVTYRTGYGTDELQADVWFDGGVPARAELSYEGALLLSAELTNFTFEA